MKNSTLPKKNTLRKNKNDAKKPVINGIILSALTVYLCVYFSLNGKWNAATVFVVILMVGLSAFQFWIYRGFFREKESKK